MESTPPPGKRNPGWFRKGPDPRRHQLTEQDRKRGGERSYGLTLMGRPTTAWWILNTRIRPRAKAKRDQVLADWIAARRTPEPDDIPY
jgi:hypothetical protein